MSGTGEAFALATSTPGPPTGRFYEIHARRPGLTDWRTFHVGLADAIAAGRVSQDWARQRAEQWGSESAIYANRVLGDFAADDEAGVIPLTWVEAAVDRWRAWKDSGDGMPIAPPVIGVDVGGGGDKTVICRRRGDVVEFIERHNTPDTMTVVGHAFPYSYEPGALTVIDAIGIGAGAASRLREQSCSVDPFNASSRSDHKDRSGAHGFLNRRAEAWWHLRELLDPAFGPTLALPDDDELIGDLSAPRWWPNSGGKIQIEAKSDVRKRLGRSPDAGDAVVMACCGLSGTWGRPEGSAEPSERVRTVGLHGRGAAKRMGLGHVVSRQEQRAQLPGRLLLRGRTAVTTLAEQVDQLLEVDRDAFRVLWRTDVVVTAKVRDATGIFDVGWAWTSGTGHWSCTCQPLPAPSSACVHIALISRLAAVPLEGCA